VTLTSGEPDTPQGLEVLKHIMRNPQRVKGEFIRANILQVMELLELNLITTYDPTTDSRGGTIYLTPEGYKLTWQNAPLS